MPITAKQHREKRANLIQKAQDFNTEHEDKETGLLTAEQEATFSKMMSDASDHLAAAKRLESLESATSSLTEGTDDAPAGGTVTVPGADVNGGGAVTKATVLIRQGNDAHGKPKYVEVESGRRGSAEYREAVQAYLRGGASGLSQDRLAALQSDDDEQAGYLVMHEQMASHVLREVDDLLFVRKYAKVHTSMTAKKLGIRKRTNRLSSFNWGSELSAPKQDEALKYGKKILEPHYGTGSILVSRDLIRNSTLSAEGEVRSEMARDSGEQMEDAYLMGDGNEKPLGIYVESPDGITASRNVMTGSNNGFTFDGLLSAKYGLKQQYRRGQMGPCRWLFHRDSIANIAKIKDNEGQPIFRVGGGRQQDTGMPEDMLLGYSVDESERAPNTLTPGNFGGSLQNWNYYEIADSLDMEIQMLVELNARTNQVEFLYRLKTDGMPTLEEAFVRLMVGT